MAKAGRKPKSGQREKSGRRSRKLRDITHDRGSDKTRDKQSVYGTDGSDAIGRAYVHGLLGEDGLNLRDTARRVFRAYWPMFAIGPDRSCLGDRTGGAAPEIVDPDERQRMIDREKWLTEILRDVDRMDKTMRTRRAFDQLVININPDNGPAWLDSLIWHSQRGQIAPLADQQSMRLAMDALEYIGR